MVSSVSCSLDRQARGPLCLFATHNSLFIILTATEYLEAICIHNLKRHNDIMMDPLIIDVVSV
jgi:hypothetical protein